MKYRSWGSLGKRMYQGMVGDLSGGCESDFPQSCRHRFVADGVVAKRQTQGGCPKVMSQQLSQLDSSQFLTQDMFKFLTRNTQTTLDSLCEVPCLDSLTSP